MAIVMCRGSLLNYSIAQSLQPDTNWESRIQYICSVKFEIGYCRIRFNGYRAYFFLFVEPKGYAEFIMGSVRDLAANLEVMFDFQIETIR